LIPGEVLLSLASASITVLPIDLASVFIGGYWEIVYSDANITIAVSGDTAYISDTVEDTVVYS
jgi:hypothetical protein